VYQQPALANNAGRYDYSYLHQTPAGGVNYYRIKSMELTGRSHYTIIMKVDIQSGAAAIVVYPNPLTGNDFSLQTTNLPKGQYQLRVYNATGQNIYAQVITHAGGSATQSVQLPSSIRKGIYQLVVNSDEIKITQTIVVQ
jgi:hypothetical protein